MGHGFYNSILIIFIEKRILGFKRCRVFYYIKISYKPIPLISIQLQQEFIRQIKFYTINDNIFLLCSTKLGLYGYKLESLLNNDSTPSFHYKIQIDENHLSTSFSCLTFFQGVFF